MEEKAATHDAMMQRFHLRKMSSALGFPSKFGRANEVVIDKAIGSKPQWSRRFSLRRSIRSFTGIKARRNAFRALISPITPKSWTSTVHGIVMLIVYHLQLLYLPFSPSYYREGSQGTTVTMILFESIFLLDLLLNFNTAYVEQGVLITSRKRIAENYIHKWFVFDLLSALPLQAIFCFATGSVSTTHSALQAAQLLLMMLRLLRVTLLEKGVLLSRVMRVANHVAEWIRYSRYSHLLGIAQLMWLVLLIAHYMACFWHVVARVHSAAESQHPDLTVGEKYVADYYYAVSLIQGQGNSIGTWAENLYSSVAIIVGSVILAIVFGNVAMLVSNFNANTTNYHRKMEAVYATMDKMDLPLKLRERVNEYYTHVWLEYEALDGNIHQFQQELTHTLGIEIGLYKHMNLIVAIPFWEDCTPDFLTQIVLNLDVRVYMPDDYVVRRREIGSEMMMINRGYCKLSKPSKPVSDPKNAHEDTLAGNSDKALLSSHDFVEIKDMEPNEMSDNDDDSDELSSDDESQGEFGRGMFGPSMDSRRLSGFPFEMLDKSATNFTDVHRFRQMHPRRPSYPNGADTKKSKRYREYLHPGQAFGEMSLLMNYKRTANIRAITFVEMCVLSRKSFQAIISRYPEDRRRVLTKMLESCIEKKVIPFPWENIIEAVSAKRRTSGNRDITRAGVIATMTAAEAARILVEAIDVNTPDETIRYGFQSFDQEFIEDSSLSHANSANVKISNTLQRRNSGTRTGQSYSRRNSRADSNDGTASSSDLESDISAASIGANSSEKTLKNLLLIVQSMATNLERLQQDVSDLKTLDRGTGCRRCEKSSSGANNFQRVASPPGDTKKKATHIDPSAPYSDPHGERKIYQSAAKKDHQVQVPRKPSLVAFPQHAAATSLASIGSSRTASGEKYPIAVLLKNRSNTQDTNSADAVGLVAEQACREKAAVAPMKSPKLELSVAPSVDTSLHWRDGDKFSERYPANLSSRSKAARNQTLADILWKRSNTNGDLLKHTDEERNALRLRRHIQSRHSMPTELVAELASLGTDDTRDDFKSGADDNSEQHPQHGFHVPVAPNPPDTPTPDRWRLDTHN